MERSALDGKVLVICLEHDDALPERHKKFSDKLQFLGAIRGPADVDIVGQWLNADRGSVQGAKIYRLIYLA